MDMNNPDYVMIYTTTIISISNTLKKLWITSDSHSYYIQTIHNYKEESINEKFITYVEPLLDGINNNALV